MNTTGQSYNNRTLYDPQMVWGVVYTADGDESAAEAKHRVFSLSGLFGSTSDWDAFRDEW